MSDKLTPLRIWMRAATADEQREFAHRVGTTRAYLYHLGASEDSNYRREPKPALAAAMERVSRDMNLATHGRLPVLYRTDLVQACAQCEYAQQCLKARKG